MKHLAIPDGAGGLRVISSAPYSDIAAAQIVFDLAIAMPQMQACAVEYLPALAMTEEAA